MNVPPHVGSKVKYTWYFGNGDVMNSTERGANYTWTEAGVYTVTMTAENKVSLVVKTVRLIDWSCGWRSGIEKVLNPPMLKGSISLNGTALHRQS